MKFRFGVKNEYIHEHTTWKVITHLSRLIIHTFVSGIHHLRRGRGCGFSMREYCSKEHV